MDDEHDKYKEAIKHRSDKLLAEAESVRDSYLAACTAREERRIQLLEQITRQLDSIEQLLRDRFEKK